MKNTERFAVVWLPAMGSRLADCAATWTGWCPETGHRINGVCDASAALVEQEALQRGLCAPILGSMALRSSVTRYHLEDVLAGVARTLPVLPSVRLGVEWGRDGLMLKPQVSSRDWRVLAVHVAHAVARLVDHPMPIPQRELSLALTDPLPELDAGAVEAFAARHFDAALAQEVLISDIALISTPGPGRPWSLENRYALGGDALDITDCSAMACLGPRLIAPLEDALAS